MFGMCSPPFKIVCTFNLFSIMNIDRAALQRKHQKEQLQAEQAFKPGLIKNEQREEIFERHEKEAMEWKTANFIGEKVG
ncbi:hypothetical protein [Bacillus sp. EB600]|uniref:hypothetical protein n=1 Tax=Bacillus sp. EB600 TaxID=2806345 RepID=UPI00210CBCE2|nr:hypothetical protein [Bacillus sp. EB600]MCQ6281369.1 hypothetical protein [Bacillus sp. EB600]